MCVLFSFLNSLQCRFGICHVLVNHMFHILRSRRCIHLTNFLLICRLCLSRAVDVSMVELWESFPWAVTMMQLVVLALWSLAILKLILEILMGWRKSLKVIDLFNCGKHMCSFTFLKLKLKFYMLTTPFCFRAWRSDLWFFVWTYPRWSWGTYLSSYKLYIWWFWLDDAP